MAASEGKCTSRIGVCIGTSGPGLANMLNGIADAAADHVPMLVITGQVESSKIGTEAKQYIDQQQFIQPLTVYSASLMHPDAAVTVLNRAIIEAIHKSGVSHISIPKDVLALPCLLSVRPPTGLLQQTHPKNLSQFDRCIEALNSARQPMIYIGEGARNASAPIVQLAAEKSKMIAAGLKPYGVDLTNPDFAALAGAFGIKSVKAGDIDSLSNALRQMYSDDQAMLLDARITDLPPQTGL